MHKEKYFLLMTLDGINFQVTYCSATADQRRPRASDLLGVGQHLFLAGEKTWPDHFGVTDTGNPVGDRGTKSAHSDRPSVRVCMRD